jgi:hypothetical protein
MVLGVHPEGVCLEAMVVNEVQLELIVRGLRTLGYEDYER